jgi:hypothetical protein
LVVDDEGKAEAWEQDIVDGKCVGRFFFIHWPEQRVRIKDFSRRSGDVAHRNFSTARYMMKALEAM